MGVISGGLEAKYVVTKEGTGEPIDPSEVFVLRANDVFGPQALFAYANAIQSLLEIHDVTEGDLLTSEQSEWLRGLADSVQDRALTWSRRMSRKLPD